MHRAACVPTFDVRIVADGQLAIGGIDHEAKCSEPEIADDVRTVVALVEK